MSEICIRSRCTLRSWRAECTCWNTLSVISWTDSTETIILSKMLEGRKDREILREILKDRWSNHSLVSQFSSIGLTLLFQFNFYDHSKLHTPSHRQTRLKTGIFYLVFHSIFYCTDIYLIDYVYGSYYHRHNHNHSRNSQRRHSKIFQS